MCLSVLFVKQCDTYIVLFRILPSAVPSLDVWLSTRPFVCLLSVKFCSWWVSLWTRAWVFSGLPHGHFMGNWRYKVKDYIPSIQTAQNNYRASNHTCQKLYKVFLFKLHTLSRPWKTLKSIFVSSAKKRKHTVALILSMNWSLPDKDVISTAITLSHNLKMKKKKRSKNLPLKSKCTFLKEIQLDTCIPCSSSVSILKPLPVF